MSPVEETSDLLDDLIRSGAPSHIVRRVAMLLATEKAAEERRAKDAARQAEKRLKNKASPQTSTDVHGHGGQPVTSASREGARAEPKITNSSEPQKKEEERKEEPPAAAPRSKTLCPLGFEPSDKAIELGRSLGLSLPDILASRDTMVAWSRGNGEKRVIWDDVFANWLRRDASKARAGPNGKPRGPSFLEISNAAKAFLKDQDPDDRPQPYLRLAQ